jgi:glycerol transport system ATP-binding protein
VVYTTTEPSEALMLGGNIVVVDQGRVLQSGPTAAVYQRPAALRVAEVFSDPPINALQGQVSGGRAFIGNHIPVPMRGHLKDLSDGTYRFAFRSHHLWLSRRVDDDVAIEGRVELAEINGSETFVHVQHDSSSFVVQQEGVHPFAMGSPVTVYLDPTHLFVYDVDGRLVAAPRSPAQRQPGGANGAY